MAREDQHFRLRIPESLRARVRAAGLNNGRSMTAEIVARLEASFTPEDVGDVDDAELLGILADMDSLKQRLIQSHKRQK